MNQFGLLKVNIPPNDSFATRTHTHTHTHTYRYDHRRAEKHDECGYNQNEGYVVFSAMGSFFIPMAVMVYVYVRISCVVAARHDHMTEIEVHKVNFTQQTNK